MVGIPWAVGFARPGRLLAAVVEGEGEGEAEAEAEAGPEGEVEGSCLRGGGI